MRTDVSAKALIDVLRRYYPSGIAAKKLHGTTSAEAQRLQDHIYSIMSEALAWSSFVQRVEASFPGCDVSSSFPECSAPSIRCVVTLPGMRPRLERTQEDAVVATISVLAPVYALYARHWKDDGTERESWSRYPPLPSEFQAHEAKLAELIETTFGATRVPNEVLFTTATGLRAPQHPFGEPWIAELLF